MIRLSIEDSIKSGKTAPNSFLLKVWHDNNENWKCWILADLEINGEFVSFDLTLVPKCWIKEVWLLDKL